MRAILLITSLFLSLTQTIAQSQNSLVAVDTFESKIHVEELGDKIKFRSELRPLVQVPGGRSPYYTYLWDFGDGYFSTEAEPSHQYKNEGEYEVTLYAINNYDDGAKPPRPVRPVRPTKSANTQHIADNSFHQNFFSSNGTFQVFKLSDAKPGEDIALVIGVNTRGKKGKVYLLTNEKVAGLDGFKFANQSKYYQERMDSASVGSQLNSLWASVTQSTFTKTGSPDYGIYEVTTFQNTQQSINYFKDLYNAYNSLTAYDIDPGTAEQQFSLINLDVTEHMLVDTNAIVTITGVFIPEDGIANVHQVDIPVVKSHDPNKMSVRPARMSYRFQTKNKTLIYKVQFQNDGEGDAKNIRLEMSLPPEIKKESFRLKALSPQCDTCITATTPGCYQYYIQEDDKLVFHFKDIALPGTAAKDITDMDSTKGFILFEIDMENKKMKNKAFQAYTNIYFDNNPPIRTNKSTSRYRQIFSPIVTVGTSATFGTPVYNDAKQDFKPGLQIGFGLAPMAPYKKLYWQAEIYSNYYKMNSTGPQITDKGEIEITLDGRQTYATYDSYYTSADRTYLSLQVPVQLRYNLNRFLSIGSGFSLRKDFNVAKRGAIHYNYSVNMAVPIEGVHTVNDSNMSSQHSDLKVNPFFDINVGKTYLGPALGVRIAYDKNQKTHAGIYGIWRL